LQKGCDPERGKKIRSDKSLIEAHAERKATGQKGVEKETKKVVIQVASLEIKGDRRRSRGKRGRLQKRKTMGPTGESIGE